MWRRSELARLIGRLSACAAVLAVSFVALPLLALAVGEALPRVLRTLLFFWPQYFLLPNGLAERGTDAIRFAGSAIYWSSSLWLTALAAYVWLTRRSRLWYVLAGLLPALAVALELLLLGVLQPLGLSVVLEGP
jgi:hypothetical protein